jgi:hypothetical protein
VLPMNSELLGTLVSVRRVGLGFSRETAMLQIKFDSITLPKGPTFQTDDSRDTL